MRSAALAPPPAARWHGGDPRALCVLTGIGLLFFAVTGAYHKSMLIPRWLGLSARVSTFLATLVAATHAHLPPRAQGRGHARVRAGTGPGP